MKRALLLFVIGCSAPTASETKTEDVPRTRVATSSIDAKNIVFIPAPGDFNAPSAKSVTLPAVYGGSAIWGATGRDHRGRIYFGVSCEGVENASAHLIEYNPDNGQTQDLGGAVEHLTRLKLARPGEAQNKIHTRILQADDGQLYFASMDESGEAEDGSKLPTFGSHLWRLTPGEANWQHLASVPEAVIASAVGGKYVYYLAYYGHVLLQIDAKTGTISRRLRVGSVGGHTTRNVIADRRGHVFVPRVTASSAELIEFDDELNEVGKTILESYSTTPNADSHGIVGVAPLADDGWAFTTDRGRLYRINPRASGTAVQDLGLIHPDGESYPAVLFSYDGRGHVCGITHRLTANAPEEWFIFDLKTKSATMKPMTIPMSGKDPKLLLVYGSTTRDDAGRAYVVGRYIRRFEHQNQSVPAAWVLNP